LLLIFSKTQNHQARPAQEGTSSGQIQHYAFETSNTAYSEATNLGRVDRTFGWLACSTKGAFSTGFLFKAFSSCGAGN
jgi:hypothetical protein